MDRVATDIVLAIAGLALFRLGLILLEALPRMVAA